MTAAPLLIVVKDKKQIARAAISKDPFTIGRSQRCDLALEDKQISREHSIISKTEHGYEIIDRDSRNGTTINGTPITRSTVLKNGDKIGIGPFEVRFHIGPEVAGMDLGDDATRFVGEEAIKEKAQASSKNKASLVYRLEAIAGPVKGNVYKNWEGDLTIGRGLDNQVVLPDDASSVLHAKIIQKDGVFFVQDLGSSNGTFLQGVRIQQERLRDGSKIRVGASTFVFRAIDVRRKKRARLLIVLTAFLMILAVVLLDKYLPEDRASAEIEQANQLATQGKYVEAEKHYKQALTLRPRDPVAVKGLEKAKKEIEVQGLLENAQAAAEQENYEQAQNLCYQVLRIQPKNEKATTLLGVMKMINEAQSATDARNWEGAIDRIEKARETYPSSELLAGLVDKARAEQAVETEFNRAKTLVRERQFMLARNILSAVPQTSVYHEEARQLIQTIEKQLTFGEALEKARAFYREGDESEAGAEIEKGLMLYPEDTDLLTLKQKLATVAGLAEQVRASKTLLSSDDADAVKQALIVATQLLATEQDPLNKFHIEAMQAVEKLQTWLKEKSAALVEEGEQHMKLQDRAAALKAFTRAAQIDPSNALAQQRATEMTKKIAEESQKYYRQGEALEELGQKDLAADAYRNVLEVALPEDVYYQKASEKLRRLK